MIEIYVNGEKFDDYDKAVAAEKKYQEEQNAKKKRDKEYENRKQEVLDALDNYEKLYDQLKKDYPDRLGTYNWGDFFNRVFS